VVEYISEEEDEAKEIYTLELSLQQIPPYFKHKLLFEE
jgi:hypothetical protein